MELMMDWTTRINSNQGIGELSPIWLLTEAVPLNLQYDGLHIANPLLLTLVIRITCREKLGCTALEGSRKSRLDIWKLDFS